MDAQLKRQLNQTISVATLSSTDVYGKITWSTPTSVSARVELLDESTYRSYFGGAPLSEYKTRHVIITENAIDETSHVWLPGDSSADATLARRPFQVLECIAEDGSVHHYETIV